LEILGLQRPTGASIKEKMTIFHNQARFTTLSGALCLGLLLCGASGCNRSLDFTVTFKESRGLKVGQKLLYKGVDIGEVTSIDLQPGAGVKVGVKVYPERKEMVYQEARFEVSSAGGLLNASGEKFLEMSDDGDKKTPIKPGDIIKGSDSMLDGMMDKVASFARKTLSVAKKAKQQVGALGKEFLDSDEGKELLELLDKMEERGGEEYEKFKKDHLPVIKKRLGEIKKKMEEKGTLDKAKGVLDDLHEALTEQ